MRLIITFLITFLSAQPGLANELCDNLALHNEVKAEIDAPAPSKDLKTISYEVEKGISKGFIKDSYREKATATILEYVMRHRRGCDIPQILRDRVYDMIVFTKSDAQMCENGQFQKIVDRQHRTLKATDGYEVFENIVKTQIEANTPPEAQEKFNTKWDNDEGFRERVIRAGLRLNTMFSSGCRNVVDPILDIIDEFK